MSTASSEEAIASPEKGKQGCSEIDVLILISRPMQRDY